MLEALVLARGYVVSRAELASALWPQCRHVEAEMGINTAVRKLRHSLGDSARNPRFVETVPQAGYRLLAPVAAAVVPTALGPSVNPRRKAVPYVAAGLPVRRALRSSRFQDSIRGTGR